MDNDTPPISVASLSDIRTARLSAVEEFASSRWLRFELTDARPLNYHGGQYVIVETGLTLPNGKPRRRAYSMLSDDRNASRFELAVYSLAGGVGCQLMHGLTLGAELRFSAPWGKLRAPVADARGPAWVIATDSGMSAALGLVRAHGFGPHLARTRLESWSCSPDYFLPPSWVRERTGACAELTFRSLAAINSSERLVDVSNRVHELLSHEQPEHVYVLGDGEVARHLQKLLTARGLDPARIHVESFFNHIERKPSSTQAA